VIKIQNQATSRKISRNGQQRLTEAEIDDQQGSPPCFGTLSVCISAGTLLERHAFRDWAWPFAASGLAPRT
jgi:hypothetical protein